VKPFECPHCDYKASREAILNKHLKVHSGIATAASSGKAVAQRAPECIYCWDAAPTLVCMPCGHLCICGDAVCIASVMDPRICPYCQEPADQVLEVAEAKAELERTGGQLYTV
jgi:hypothetical protein